MVVILVIIWGACYLPLHCNVLIGFFALQVVQKVMLPQYSLSSLRVYSEFDSYRMYRSMTQTGRLLKFQSTPLDLFSENVPWLYQKEISHNSCQKLLRNSAEVISCTQICKDADLFYGDYYFLSSWIQPLTLPPSGIRITEPILSMRHICWWMLAKKMKSPAAARDFGHWTTALPKDPFLPLIRIASIDKAK